MFIMVNNLNCGPFRVNTLLGKFIQKWFKVYIFVSKKVLIKINKSLFSATANTEHNMIHYVQTSGISEFTDGKDAGLENLQYF